MSPRFEAGAVAGEGPSLAVPVAAPGRSVLADYATLCKFRLNSLVLATTFGGAWIASGGEARATLFLHALGGTGLVAAGASALNMVLERERDARMHRTRNRPLPAGRLQPAEAVLFGTVAAVAGLAWLALGTTLLATALAAVTLVTYLFLYTPMKGRSACNTLVGAVPGAVPPMIGWAATGAGLDAGAWVLFSILYLWQIPHFLSIAWLYREDYRRAGMVMLPGVDGDGTATGRQAVLHAAGLTLVSLFATSVGIAGGVYFAGAIALGAGFTAVAALFARARTEARARALLRASLLYLPLLFALLGLDLRD